MIHQVFLSGQEDAPVATGLVGLRSCYIVFHFFCSRGDIAVSLIYFPAGQMGWLIIISTSRNALVLCSPGVGSG